MSRAVIGVLLASCHALPSQRAVFLAHDGNAIGDSESLASSAARGQRAASISPRGRLGGGRPVQLVREGADELGPIVRDMLAAQELLPVSDVCAKLTLDAMACTRVQAYIGKTLLDLTQPLRLKHRLHERAYHTGFGEVTTKHGLENAIMSDMRNEVGVVKEFSSSFAYIPSDTGNDLPFVMTAGDDSWWKVYKYPTLVRSAPVPDQSGNHVVIMIQRHRYEDPIAKLPTVDIPFQNKLDALVWRGSTTGAETLSKCTGQWPNRSRRLLVQKYFNSSDTSIDIGFGGQLVMNIPEGWNRGAMDMANLLKYKFIMVVDGNSEPSGMEWAMASNSVPFMAPPVLQTWSLHSWLQPWKHYVPVEPDFSDLSVKLAWAKSNQAQVAQIAAAGAVFMQEFTDKAREARINAAVLMAYFNRFRIENSTDESSLCEAACDAAVKSEC